MSATGLKSRTIVLLGNPNTGKTTLFNALTGMRLRTGNYPGVTVEKKVGALLGEADVDVLDLPGTYSLAARSPDEMVAVDVLVGRQEGAPVPDAAVVVVDASNLERNLYLVTQIMETGLPVVLALNMSDLADRRGLGVDHAALQQRLGIPVVPLVARAGTGVDELRAAMVAAIGAPPPKPGWSWPSEIQAAEASLAAVEPDHPKFELRRALFDQAGEAEHRFGNPEALAAAREQAGGTIALQVKESEIRYGFIGEVIAAVVTRPEAPRVTRTERIDAILTHKVWGTGLLVLVGYFVFMSIFEWATPVMDFVEATFAMLGDQVAAVSFLGDGALKSLLVDGVITGVGGVVVFLPQILVLFAFIAILEDCGYMARAAFLMDRLLRWCGLSGRSFIPLLSSFACAVPGIMATRTIESRRDRLVTILVAPLMTCSARIPIYVILTAAFVPATMVLGFVNLQALVFASLYFLGIAVAVLVAWALRRTKFRGAPTPFLMELPPYKMPSPNIVVQRMLRQATHFLSRAGTLILASSLVIWALAYWPRAEFVQPATGTSAASEMTADQLQLQQSFLGRMGRAVEPAFAPMGWDWKVSIAVIASFPAREVVVSTLGVIYGLGEVDEESTALRERIRDVTWDHGPKQGEPVLDLAGALALMVFFALCAQCAATLMTIGKETGSWGWPVFTFVYMTTLAYVGAIVTAVLARAMLA